MNRCWSNRNISSRCIVAWSGTAAVCIALVSCGVPTQDLAKPLASGVIAPPALPSATGVETSVEQQVQVQVPLTPKVLRQALP